MTILIPEQNLPQALSVEQAVDAAYATELAQIASELKRGLPVLIECEKDLAPFLFMNVRGRLKPANIKCLYADGHTEDAAGQPALGGGFVGAMLTQLRDAVRGAVERRVVVLPHLDLLTSGHGGLSPETREVIPLLYENPELVWLGFKDPSFALPRVIENLFPRRHNLLGVPRPRLPQLITRGESRKFGKGFNPWALYKYVSGMNAARLRKLLATLEGEDFPADPRGAYEQIRQATVAGQLEIPTIDLERDIGGYTGVKQKLRAEILDVLAAKDRAASADELARIEALIPRGMIFWGPPGTGKTMFAKAMASALGAAVTIVSGPELKSRWVGESEENLRQIFHRARQSAPSVIVFDELDSFASARGTYKGSGVEHSMVNQLLTEMDGFHREELVFVVGTTNFVESLDPALLRPGRFEFHLHIPYPDADDRREILRIYDRSMGLQFSPAALEHAVGRTGGLVESALGTHYSGDHLNALCRAIARIRLRENISGPTEIAGVERGLSAWTERAPRSPEFETTAATHEAGHALCSVLCPGSTPIESFAIDGDASAALGVERLEDQLAQFEVNASRLVDDLCVLWGGAEAERLLLAEVSLAGAADGSRADALARAICERWEAFEAPASEVPQPRAVGLGARSLELAEDARARATVLLSANREALVAIRDRLLQRCSLDRDQLAAAAAKHSSPKR
jgi:cell division protease FtsH